VRRRRVSLTSESKWEEERREREASAVGREGGGMLVCVVG
jgi:hypothetical protein